MTVLLAYRPNDEGRAALDVAVVEAKARGEELLIVRHVHADAGDAQVNKQTAEVEGELQRLEEKVVAQGVACRTSWSVGPGKAGDAVVQLAERENPSVIVIGMRSRSAVGKLVLGSDSQDILLHAHQPVLAVKVAEDAD